MSIASSEYTEASEGDLDDDYFDDYVRASCRRLCSCNVVAVYVLYMYYIIMYGRSTMREMEGRNSTQSWSVRFKE